jgi:predicted nucleic acid-binding protein
LAEKNKIKIFYSGFVLKELLFTLSTNEYITKRVLFDKSNFKKVMGSKEDCKLARKIKIKTSCSPYDILHLILAKKSKSVLITRDKELLKLAKKFKLRAKTPEDFIAN